jgi:ATP-dependent helicase Lhr and Lhr-like helicase
VSALEALLVRIASGEVRVHFRDTTQPSVFTHEILSARPYTFLDDAPLEERRTRSVVVPRGLPAQARDLTVLDVAALARVRGEVALAARSAIDLYDVLMQCGVVPEDSAMLVWFEQLQHDGRAVVLRVDGVVFWAARERALEIQALYPAALCDSVLPLTAASSPRTREDCLDGIVSGHMECLGPCTAEELTARTRLAHDDVVATLARLEHAGFALQGRFEAHEAAAQYCARRLLARVHAYTQKRLRAEIEPVTAQDFMRFLLRHHGVEPQHQRMGARGVLLAIEQLQGYEVAAASWENDVLPARVASYHREWLDGLCLSGQVCWGRVSLPSAVAAGGGAAQPTRATPITLAVRNDLPWLLAAARAQAEGRAASSADAQRVLAQLEDSGALFFSQLVALTGLSDAAVREALWDGVARGLLSADGFEALRNLLAPSLGAAVFPLLRRTALRTGARSAPHAEGRWSLMRAAFSEIEYDALCEAVAEQWVARWGVVFRELAGTERCALPYRDVVYALRRLEARGVLRGGRFVTGFSGEQYALPGAVEQLRAVRRESRRGVRIELSACDPLNLTGVLFSGPRVPAQATQRVVFVDGAPESDGQAAGLPMTS